MLEIKENTPPVDVIGERRWSIRVTRYMNAAEYDLMCGAGCYGTFRTIEELNDFADLLQSDLDANRAMPTDTRKACAEVVAAIREVREGEA